MSLAYHDQIKRKKVDDMAVTLSLRHWPIPPYSSKVLSSSFSLSDDTSIPRDLRLSRVFGDFSGGEGCSIGREKYTISTEGCVIPKSCVNYTSTSEIFKADTPKFFAESPK